MVGNGVDISDQVASESSSDSGCGDDGLRSHVSAVLWAIPMALGDGFKSLDKQPRGVRIFAYCYLGVLALLFIVKMIWPN